MATQEIDRTVWPAFFDDFSRQNEGSMARIETMGADVGDQQTGTLPFQGISFDTKGSGAGSITIMLGTEEADHLERTLASPTHVTLKPAGEAGPTVLEIQVKDDATTLLHLEPVLALPAP
jgi:hypothetical protein